jgi:hypothetical protein
VSSRTTLLPRSAGAALPCWRRLRRVTQAHGGMPKVFGTTSHVCALVNAVNVQSRASGGAVAPRARACGRVQARDQHRPAGARQRARQRRNQAQRAQQSSTRPSPRAWHRRTAPWRAPRRRHHGFAEAVRPRRRRLRRLPLLWALRPPWTARLLAAAGPAAAAARMTMAPPLPPLPPPLPPAAVAAQKAAARRAAQDLCGRRET